WWTATSTRSALASRSGWRGRPPTAARPSPCSPRASSLDHLVCPLQERRRDRQAEGPCGLQVDDELELRRPLDREVSRLSALEDPLREARGAAIVVGVVHSVDHQPPDEL